MAWIGIGLGVLFLVALATGGILYAPFSHRPEKRWRDRVRRLVAAAREQLHLAQHELHSLNVSRERDQRNYRDRAWISYFHTYPADRLAGCPGIDPTTVAKLRESGYTTLALLQNTRIEIDDL